MEQKILIKEKKKLMRKLINYIIMLILILQRLGHILQGIAVVQIWVLQLLMTIKYMIMVSKQFKQELLCLMVWRKNIYTRALSNIIDIKDDFRTSKEGNKKAALNYFTEPKVPVYVSAGKNDRLVNPKDAFYRPATSFKVLDHKDSGHFGTSGQNKKMNNYFINEIKDIENKYNITKIHKPSNYYWNKLFLSSWNS